MQISDDTQKVLDFLMDYSNNSLRKPNDIATILEISATYGLVDEIKDLLFYGKSLWNIHKTIKRNDTNEDNIVNLIEESKKIYKIIVNLLETISSLSSENDKTRFISHYLGVTSGNYLNIIDLAHDLSLLKNLQIDVQQKTS